jgi:phosphoglucomutase
MMITFYLLGGATVTVRASATEPKLKYYLEVVADDPAAGAQLAARCQVAVREELVRPEEHGLVVPSH